MAHHRGSILLLLIVGLSAAGTVEGIEIGPEGDLCAEINALLPGEELVLLPGEYKGPCLIRNSGTAAEPLVIRGKDLRRKPHITYLGDQANVFNIAGSHIVIRGLAFGATAPNVDAIRVRSGDFITVEDCEFIRLGGIAVVANHRSVRGLTVRRNQIVNSRASAIYLGCHNGLSCVVEELVVEENYINGVEAADPEIGYGIQIKLNSVGQIRDNVIVNTKGPGIMVYGATRPTRVNVIERNAVTGSRQSAAIVLGGGPAIVRNNVVTDSFEGGIRLQDYGDRGLLRSISILHNTVYTKAARGIKVPHAAPLSNIRIINNAVHAHPGDPPFPRTRSGLLSVGNVNCTAAPCFRDADLRDFSPQAGSPLSGGAVPRAGLDIPTDDFTGAPRGHTPSVGAFDAPAPPIPLGFKPMHRPPGAELAVDPAEVR